MRERLGPLVNEGWVPDGEVWQATVVSQLNPDDRPEAGGEVAGTKDPLAANFHTNEIATHTPYDLTQQWAAAWRKAGFTGVQYQPRFTTDPTVDAEGWFGRAGAPTPEPPARLMDDDEWKPSVGLKVVPLTIPISKAAIIDD